MQALVIGLACGGETVLFNSDFCTHDNVTW